MSVIDTAFLAEIFFSKKVLTPARIEPRESRSKPLPNMGRLLLSPGWSSGLSGGPWTQDLGVRSSLESELFSEKIFRPKMPRQ